MARDDSLYQLVATRRLHWDNLIWQVPVLSLTAQAFLFTIALGADTSRFARVIAASLSLVVTFLSITLMARHRQAALADQKWLEQYDEDHRPELVQQVHGQTFAKRRDEQPLEAGWMDAIIPIYPGFRTWVVGLSLFGMAAAAVLLVTLLIPSLLAAPTG